MKHSDTGEQVKQGRDRRQFTRVAAEAMPQLTARLVGGPDVRLIDVSRRGAQVETTMPLKPGRPVTIRFVAVDATLTLTGAVVRSSVAVLAEDGVKYHTALSFVEDVDICPTLTAADLTGAATGTLRSPEGTVRGIAADDLTGVMVVRAPDETRHALKERLLANSW